VKVDSTSETDAVEAIKSLGDKITKIDIVIANAAIFKLSAFKPVAEMQISDLMEHFAVNTAGPVRLFQATLHFSKKPPSQS
jgi:norsolorinic acid ketoreductase